MAGFVLIEDLVLDSAASIITFNTGLTDYTRFRLTLYVKKDGSVGRAVLRLNGSASGYATQQVYAYDSGQFSNRNTSNSSTLGDNNTSIGANQTAVYVVEVSKPLATVPARYLAHVSFIRSPGINWASTVGQWNNTAALISSIRIQSSSGGFAAGTRMVLEASP